MNIISLVTNTIYQCLYIVMLCLLLCASNSNAASVSLTNVSAISNSDVGASTTVIEYKVMFEQMSPEQHLSMRMFYTQYTGYKQHTVDSQDTDTTVVTYISNAPIDLLVNNFTKTAEHLGLQVLVRGAKHIISVRFVKLNAKSLPYKEW